MMERVYEIPAGQVKVSIDIGDKAITAVAVCLQCGATITRSVIEYGDRPDADAYREAFEKADHDKLVAVNHVCGRVMH